MIKSKKNAKKRLKSKYISKRRITNKHRDKHENGKCWCGKYHKRMTRRKSKTKSRNISGGSIGNDLRFELVNLCKSGNWEKYDRLTQKIKNDYYRGKNDFLNYLDQYMHTFKNPVTILCLEQVLTTLQEDAIPESMRHLEYIWNYKKMKNITLNDVL